MTLLFDQAVRKRVLELNLGKIIPLIEPESSEELVDALITAGYGG